MDKFINIWVRVTVFIVILMTAATGWKNLSNHFSIYDDIGVAETIFIETEATNLRAKILVKALCTLSVNALEPCPYISISKKLFAVPSYWTYAPFQFYWTAILLNRAENLPYEKIKFLGRLPSYIFGWAGIGLLYFFVFRKVFRSNLVALICTAFLASSLELRIFEAQMMSYSIGMLSNALIISTILLLTHVDLSSKKIIMGALVISVAVAMQYQGLLLFAAGLLAVTLYSRPLQIKKTFLLLIFTAITIFSICGNIFTKSNKAISWNSGPHNEYIVLGEHGLERIANFFLLIYENISYNIYYISTPILLENQYIYLYSYFAISLIVIGVLLNFKNSNKFVLIFLGLYLTLYFLLIYLGKLAFSPSRHSLYLLPVFVALIGTGLDCLYRVNRVIFNLIAFAICFFLVVSAYFSIGFFKGRTDPVKEQDFVSLMMENKPQFIIYDSRNTEIKYMHDLKVYPLFRYAQGSDNFIRCPLGREIQIPGTVIFYSSSNSINDEKLYEYINQIFSECNVQNQKKDKILIRYDGLISESIGASPLELTSKLDSTLNSLYIHRFQIQSVNN